MKKKLVITVVSVVLNLALFSALAYFNKINNRAESTPALVYVYQHLTDGGHTESASHGIALASTLK